MKTIANEYETLEAIKKAMAMYELKKADKDHVATPRYVVEDIYSLIDIESFKSLWFPFNHYDSLFKLRADELVLFISDTRDKAIEYYKDNVIPLIQKKIEVNGLDKFRKEVEKAKKYMVETHGERPEIKDIEEEDE
ncbi:hypothetical protein NU342_00090 [Listeria monocytogenes]|uniref:hypothetical protein n=1 Tax=Listeria monocytogenes TaxID=1639 RepID=UPI002151A601|nr:hypothetical protein [Listeria monocytogenes]MCR6443874.1 hypothetical protein [Listeria monocytogenes]